MMNHKTTEEIMALDRQNHMGAYGRFPAALTSGKGAAAFDPEGKRYIDFGSGIGVNSLGYADEGWVQAVSGQAARIQHTSNRFRAVDNKYSKAQLFKLPFAQRLQRAKVFPRGFQLREGKFAAVAFCSCR